MLSIIDCESQKRQGPVSNMQRLAGPMVPFSWSYPVWSGFLPMALITRMRSITIFLCASLFWQTNKQPSDLRASLLLTSEKAVFCNNYDQEMFESIEKLLSLSRNFLINLDTFEPIRKLFQSIWKILSPSRIL